MNLYAYANGNPVNYTDPQGTQAFNNALTNFATQNTSYFGDSTGPTGMGGLWSGGQSLAGTSTSQSNSSASNISNDAVWNSFAVAGTAALAEPTPIGELVVGAAILGYGAYTLVNKMAAEIQGITERNLGPQGEVYSLRANQPGDYPNVRGGTTFLNAGDVYRYGETTQPDARYSNSDLRRQGLEYQTEYQGSQTMAKIVEKQRIYGHFFEYGALPPGNRIFR